LTLTTRQLRSFGLIVGALFAGWFGLFIPWLRHHRAPVWPWAAAILLIALGLAAPRTLHYPYLAWTQIGKALGWLNSRILLSLMFFVIFAPAGLIARLFGWDPLDRNFQPDAQSYRVIAPPQPITHMEKPY